MQTSYLGIDIGSISLKSALLDQQGEIIHTTYIATCGRPIEALKKLLTDHIACFGDIGLSGIAITGSGKGIVAAELELPTLNEIIAHAHACWYQFPGVKSIIEIGGQDSKFIEIDRRKNGKPFVLRHAFNGLCSAGTGAFLDHQAQRLGLTIEEFSGQAYQAATVPPIAGRCSVFAKSDMIHLQQKGVLSDAIAAGLCHALARNYIASLCKGRPAEPPVVFQGGVASNRGMIRAFASVLGIAEHELLVPVHHKVMGAIGAGLHAREKPLVSERPLSRLVRKLENMTGTTAASHRPRLNQTIRQQKPWPEADQASQAFLGVDVGSVTTKAVLMAGDGAILASSYTPTRSQPVEAARRVLSEVQRQRPDMPRIGAFYTTGSGRYLVRDIFSADGAIDEISAQARSTNELSFPVDTIIEIGGQDSKFIRLKDGHITDFIMNRMCAAGTGSFLEEQAGRLDVNIAQDFSALAFKAQTPADLGTRCTVFMDSDLVHHIQQGHPKEDLCAGLAYSIAQNYLDMVVHSRPLGEHVVFQGGVANNRAVHAAFETLTGHKVTIHPSPTLSGALGAALAARDEMSGATSRFIGFEKIVQPYSQGSFICDGCENSCEIQTAVAADGQRSAFGSLCGKHETSHPLASSRTESLFSLRQELLTADYLQEASYVSKVSRGTIGIPFGLTMLEQYPFWKAFFRSLGFDPVASGPTNRKIAELGTQNIPVEICMPMKILYGHALYLKSKGINRLFVPHSTRHPADGETKPRHYCLYTQAAGYMIRSKISAETIILEYPDTQDEKGWIRTAAKTLGIRRDEITRAFEQAQASMYAFRLKCRNKGREVLARSDLTGKKPVVLIGRPYHLGDRYLTMDLARHLERLGALPIPMDFLVLKQGEVPPFYGDMHWYMGRQELKAADMVSRDESLAAICVTNFGCGPDAFIGQFLESVLEHTPHLILEFDEHRADTGMLTRIEAFLRTLDKPRGERRIDKRLARKPVGKDRSLKLYRYYIPHFSDHAYAFMGALRAVGCRAEILPATSQESVRLAKRHAHGSECHAYFTILGDLLRLVQTPGFDPDGAAYYLPQYIGPCLLNQFQNATRIILERLGVGNIALLDLGDPDIMKEVCPAYYNYLVRSGYAIDRLFKWASEIRAYEKNKDEVQAVHQANLELIARCMEEHSLDQGIREAAANMRAIPLHDKRDLPAIGVAGDIYTRVNMQANDGLFERLNAMGFEVWPSAMMIDMVFMALEQQVKELLDKKSYVKALMALRYIMAARLLRISVDRHFPEGIRTPQESSFLQVLKRISPYINHKLDMFISLNINRIGEFHAAGASGVLNAMCPNCMIGTMSEAFFPELRGQYDNLPLESLHYGERQAIHLNNRIEAFAHLVKEMHGR